MAEEYRRSRGRKKIILPSGDEIYIPVLTSISLIDPRDRYQEHQYGIDNSAQADRDAHVDDVYPVTVDADGKPIHDPPEQDTSGDPLKVERIDVWKVLDPRSRYQEQQVAFDNRTGAELLPPSFTEHQQTHIYRYYQDPENPDDGGIWIDSEFMDQLSHVDPRSRYQETVHSLNNPTNAEFRGGDLSGQASSDDPDVTIGGGEGTEENPVRLDPFQNIVNFNDKIAKVIFGFHPDINNVFTGDATNTGIPYTDPAPGPTNIDPWPPGTPGSGYNAVQAYVSSIDWTLLNTSPVNCPDITPTTIHQTFDDWKVNYGNATTGPTVTLTTGSPLVVNGKTIVGYLDTLTYKFAVLYFMDLSDHENYYTVATGPNWWEFEGARIAGSWDSSQHFTPTTTHDSGEQTATISSDPFQYTWPSGKISWLKALGLRDPSVPDSTPGFKDHGEIYCIRVPAP